MNREHNCKAWVDGKLVEVIACYEVEYLTPLVYGIFAGDTDVTTKIHKDEFDRIYREISESWLDDMTDAAEAVCEGER